MNGGAAHIRSCRRGRVSQAQAGHRSIESTRVYLHLTNDWLAEAVR
jgi:site-specific recombinase XerD